MSNLQNEINELRIKNAKELERKEKQLAIQVQLFELTGIKFMVMIHEYKTENHTHIWCENSQYEKKFDRQKIEEYYKAICTIYTPCNAPLKFSGNTKYNNAGPVKITIDNNTADIVFNHAPTAKIEFSFENDITVSFKMQAPPHYNNFSADVLQTMHYVGKPDNKRDRQEKTMYKIAGFNCIPVYGNSYVTYCEDILNVPALLGIAFTGKNL